MSDRIAAGPQLVELPANLPEVYRQHIIDLIATLSDKSVAGVLGDKLRRMIDRITIRHDPDARHLTAVCCGFRALRFLPAYHPTDLARGIRPFVDLLLTRREDSKKPR